MAARRTLCRPFAAHRSEQVELDCGVHAVQSRTAPKPPPGKPGYHLPQRPMPPIHPHLGTTLWIGGHCCVSPRTTSRQSTAGRHGPRPRAGAVHTAPRRPNCADVLRPHCPQDLLLLLVFSFPRKPLTTSAVDETTPADPARTVPSR